jgi:hypothetical protein
VGEEGDIKFFLVFLVFLLSPHSLLPIPHSLFLWLNLSDYTITKYFSFMQTEPNHPVDGGASIADTRDKDEILIVRSQRRNFFLIFTSMTIVGWIVGGIASIAVEKAITEQVMPYATPLMQELWYSLGNSVSMTIFALIFAADQAIAVRRYVNGWLWFLATGFGWLAANKVSYAWITYIQSLAVSLNRELSPKETIIFTLLSTSAYIFSGIWIGFFQWVILRRYTKGAWWWNFLNSFSFFLISFLVLLLSLIQNFIPEVYRAQVLYLSEQGLTALILAIIPAIGWCRLKIRE